MRSLFLLTLFLSSITAHAATLSFTGTLTNASDVQLFNFTIDSSSEVTLQTLSYGGGMNADGDLILAGGFDPGLVLFDGSGNFIAQNDDAFDDGFIVPADPNTGFQFDSVLVASLGQGDYTVALMPFPIFATGPTLADGFQVFDTQNFNGRTDSWALDIEGVSSATEAAVISAVPVPAAVWLLGTGLIGLMGMMKMKKTA